MAQPQPEKLTCALINHGLAISHDGTRLSPCCQYKSHLVPPVSWLEFNRYQHEVKPRLIKEFEQGNKIDACSHCWQEEKIGYTSLRQQSNRLYSQFDSLDTFDLEFRPGNHCNLACMMCHSKASSTWYTELTTKKHIFKDVTAISNHPLVPPTPAYWEDPKFWEFLQPHLSTVRRINIAGGEPLTLPGTHHLLDQLIRLERTDVQLQFTTNFTKISDSLIKKLELFENLALVISLEGIGAMNDYVRYPSRWAEIENNIQRVKDTSTIRLEHVHHVLQHTSVYSLPALVDWCQQQKMFLTLTYVQGHTSLVLESVPPEDLKQFVVWGKENNYISPNVQTAIVNLENTIFDEELFLQFRQYVSALDQSRGTNYDKIFNPSRRC